MKVYFLECSPNPNGIKTVKTIYTAVKNKENGRYYVRVKDKYYSKRIEVLVDIGTYIAKTKEDKTTVAETWCMSKDYKKSRLKLIEMLKECIPNMKRNVLELEKDVRIRKHKMYYYKKSVNAFIKKTKEITY